MRTVANRFVNAWYAARHQRPRADFVGRHVAEILGPARYHDARPHLDAALAGTRTSFEVASTSDAGRVRHHTVQTVLERYGARVSAAASADEALDVLRRTPIDVLVSDIGMPGADGYDLIRRVRRMDGGSRIPTIAVTAYASAEDRARAVASGFQTHAAKPLDPAVLVEVVATAAHCRDRAPE